MSYSNVGKGNYICFTSPEQSLQYTCHENMSGSSTSAGNRTSLKSTIITPICLGIALFAALAGLSWWTHRVTPELRRARNLRSFPPGLSLEREAGIAASILATFPLVKYGQIPVKQPDSSKWSFHGYFRPVTNFWQGRNRIWQEQSEESLCSGGPC